MSDTYREATIQLPEAASTLAPQVDSLYYDIFWISVAFFIGIVGCMVWFAYRYRRRPGHTSRPPGHHNALELFWTFSPLLLLAYMFHQGFEGYMFMSVPPENSLNIRVEAVSWGWKYEHPNGYEDTTGLVVPVGRPIRLIMSSVPSAERPAVLHSYFAPAFRIKRDVVPGMYTSLWFEATRTGQYQVFCTEYCGSGHSGMSSTIRVVGEAEYEEYLRAAYERPDEYDNDIEWGENLFSANACTTCHNNESPDRMGKTGPSLYGVAGTAQPLTDGTEVIADADYLRNSIRAPASQIVRGYPNVMPQQWGGMPETQLNALVAYLASISPDAGSSVAEELAAEAGGN